jgi:mannosylglycerate hydrolase MGH1-like protein
VKSHDVLLMPDKWEYPWFAVWDSAFQAVSIMLVDTDFAKEQLSVFLDDRYQHPNGQLPAYEWNFGDVNPPVHAWATLTVYNFDKARRDGNGDLGFLTHAFERLCHNFNWWIEQKEVSGRNVFEGGFLGLDNIGVFDRSSELPTGGRIEQSDGTAWMAFFAQCMLTIAMELARYDTRYEDKVLEYLDHFLRIASAMDRIGENNDEMWDEDDGFFYDVLHFPDGHATRIKVRSLVGFIPLCAVSVIDPEALEKLPRLRDRYNALVNQKREGLKNIACPEEPGIADRRLLAILDEEKLRRVLVRMLDEAEFLSPFSIRSLSKYHASSPYTFNWGDQQFQVAYAPGESDSGMFGGNSNWRGPIWMPLNMLIIQSLVSLYAYYGDTFQIECPTGSGRKKNLYQVADFLSDRLIKIFIRDKSGERPVFGGLKRLQKDPNWRDYVLFYEYFNGDNGAGLGAGHQTGWTAGIAMLLAFFGSVEAQEVKEGSAEEVIEEFAEALTPDDGTG